MKLIQKIQNIKVRMTWKDVILYSIAVAVYTALCLMIPFLKNTSFYDIGVSFECWVLFAVIVVVNCEKPLDAALKCFVFFLISQPLIYLIQVMFGTLSFEMAFYYYRVVWFKWTLLTLPGGFIAYYCKKQTLLGSVILGIGNAIILMMGAYYTTELKEVFPQHLLTIIYCAVCPVILTLVIQKQKKYRVVSLGVAIAITAAVFLFIA